MYGFAFAEDAEHRFLYGQSMDRDRGWRDRQYGGNPHGADHDDDMAVEGGEGSEGDRMVAGGVAMGYHHGGNDADL
ncbi:hypothetical protein BHM03_00002693 [Ensete ventricosum]|nr:hypothetical protein BHM03_00002693 [Ensete ventricosum]